jgi:hypothetical protein
VATSIAWASKVITVNQADLDFVSGTFYTMDTNQFRKDLNALQASLEGIWADTTHLHNTEVTVAGTTFARTIEIINGYTVQFSPNSQWTVQLLGSNNNIFDVGNGILVQNQVQVLPTNSAGLIVTTTTGLTTEESAELSLIATLSRNRREINLATGIETIYDAADLPLFTRQVWVDDDGTIKYDGTLVPHRVDRYA